MSPPRPPAAPDNDAKATASVKSARRVFEVLEFFDAHQAEATAIEVAQALDYPQSSTSVLMRTMTGLGYLHFDRSRRTYVPTARVAMLGQWLNTPLFRDGRLGALMQDLSARTGETIILAIRNGLQAQYLNAIQATVPARLYVQAGTFRPLTRSGVGLALLSALPDGEARRLVKRINDDEHDPACRVPVESLMTELAQTRQRGYSLSYNRVTLGAGVVGAVLPQPAGTQPLAIAIASVAENIRQHGHAHGELLVKVVREHVGGP